MLDETLIPPDELLFDGTGTRQQFIDGGPGFLWNSLVARARLEPHHTILDIGSGNGKHARVLTEFLQGGSYAGFDIVPDGIRWCQDRYGRFPNFRFDLAEVHSDWYNPDCTVMPEDYVFPYNDESFDVAFAASLFTHLEPAATINYFRQTHRTLKNGGRLLLTCFLINDFNRGRQAQDVQDRQFSQASDAHWVIDANNPSRGVAYDEAALRQMLIDAGFVVAEMTFGTWANRIDALSAFQDTIVAIK